jgi:hypothetical protein
MFIYIIGAQIKLKVRQVPSKKKGSAESKKFASDLVLGSCANSFRVRLAKDGEKEIGSFKNFLIFEQP